MVSKEYIDYKFKKMEYFDLQRLMVVTFLFGSLLLHHDVVQGFLHMSIALVGFVWAQYKYYRVEVID